MQIPTRIAIIGSTGRGDYGHNLDTTWLKIPKCEIVAVADPDKGGLAAAAKRLNVRETYTDYREMLERARPEIVTICPRWVDQHRDMVVAAAERGIHIFLEKPLCRTLAEADEMVAACERSHVKLAIALQTRYSPKLPVVQDLIASGKLGRVLEFRGRGKEDPRGGAEDLCVLGPHIFNLIGTLAGKPTWCLASVTHQGKPIARADATEGNEGFGLLAGDAVRAMYGGLANNETAYFNSERLAMGKPSRFGLMIYGTQGVLEVLSGYLPSVQFLPDPGWTPGRSKAKWQPVSSRGIGQPETLEDGGLDAGNVLVARDLLEAIRDDRQPLASVYDARDALEMVVAPLAAATNGGAVELPLRNRQNPLAS